MTNLTEAFLRASAEAALLEAGATSEERSEILASESVPREVLMWQNPQQWAKYSLTMSRMRRVTIAERADADQKN
jgi:hypothetical protein